MITVFIIVSRSRTSIIIMLLLTLFLLLMTVPHDCSSLLFAAHDVLSRLLLHVPGGSALRPDDAHYRHPEDTK